MQKITLLNRLQFHHSSKPDLIFININRARAPIFPIEI